MSTQPAATAADTAASDRSHLGNVALALTVLSVIGFLVLLIGDVADWKGFSEADSESSTLGDVMWTMYALGGLIALVTGIVAWVRGRSRGLLGDVRAGQLAVAWVVLSLAISIVWSAVN